MKNQSTAFHDYEAEAAALARQMKIAEAMQASGMAPPGQTEVVGGYAVKKSPLEGVAKVLQAVMGAKLQNDLQGKQQDLSSRYRADLSSGVHRFIDGISTQPGRQPAQTGNNPSAYVAAQEFSAADAVNARRRAVMEAIASNHPMLQQLGMSQLKTLEEGRLTPKDVFQYGDTETQRRMATQAGVAGFQPKRNTKEVGGVLYDADTMQVLQLKDGYDPKSILTIQGDTYQINPSTRKLEKMDNATKIVNNVHPGNIHLYGQKAGFEKWSEAAAKRVAEMAEKAEAARNLVSRTNQLEALTTAGTHAGPAAGAAVFMAGLARQLGVPVDENKLANSATFESESTRAWAEMMQSLGGARGLVKEESEKIAKSLPELSQSPQGRQQIIALIRQAAEQQIRDAELANQEYGKALQAQDPAQFTFGLSRATLPQSGSLPPAPGGTSQRKPTIKNW